MCQPSLHAAPRRAPDCGDAATALPSVATLVHTTPTESRRMYIHYSLAPLVSLVAGILILVMPRLLNYIVAIYLIIIGIVGLVVLHAGTAV